MIFICSIILKFIKKSVDVVIIFSEFLKMDFYTIQDNNLRIKINDKN